MHKRKSTGARLRTELIGLSPLPGSPPAAYGSIIIPCAYRGHHRGQPGLSSYKCNRSHLLMVMAHLRTQLEVSFSTRNVPIECVFNFQAAGGHFGPSSTYRTVRAEKRKQKSKKFEKFLKPTFLLEKSASNDASRYFRINKKEPLTP